MSCRERRRELLHSLELFGRWRNICFTCSGIARRLDPMPDDLVTLIAALKRDRRAGPRRSELFGFSLNERRDTSERRSGGRRWHAFEVDNGWLIDEEHLVSDLDQALNDVDRLLHERDGSGHSFELCPSEREDVTCIRAMPLSAPPF